MVSGRDVDRPWRSHSTSGLKPELLLKPSIVSWFLWKVLPLKQMGALGVVVGCVHVLARMSVTLRHTMKDRYTEFPNLTAREGREDLALQQ